MSLNRTVCLLPLCLLLSACVLEDGGETDPSALGAGKGDPGADDLAFDPGAGDECLDETTQNTYGLCLCDAFSEVGRLRVERLHAGMPASVGVNGFTRWVSDVKVDGGWFGYGGIHAVAQSRIEGDVFTTGNFDWVGRQSIGGNLSVGGNLSGTGEIEVGGDVAVGGDNRLVGWGEVGGEAPYAAPDAPPCPCDGETFFDVQAAVDGAAVDNDNAMVGLSPEGYLNVGSDALVLPTGRYYLADMTQVGQLQLRIEGNVTLYVDGDMESVGDESLEIAEGASLDLYVAGQLRSVGRLRTGDESTASRFRLAIGGDDAVMLNVGQQHFYGHIYAPTAELRLVGDTLIHGSLFADKLTGVGNLTIVHSSAEAPPPEQCGGTAEPPR